MSRQAIAKHLAVLEEAGLVTHARAGGETRYALDAAPLGDAATGWRPPGAAWDDRLARLATSPRSSAR